jgi:hypothetical protein
MNFLSVSYFTRGDRYLNYSAKRGQMGCRCEKYRLTRNTPIGGRSRTMPDTDPTSVAGVSILSLGTGGVRGLALVGRQALVYKR